MTVDPSAANTWIIGLLAACPTILVIIKIVKELRPAERNPPMPEEAAKLYVTKVEMQQCQGICRKDIDDIRASIAENDRQAENRAKGTHARIDALYREQQKVNKSLGMLIGIMIGMGKAPPSIATQLEPGE